MTDFSVKLTGKWAAARSLLQPFAVRRAVDKAVAAEAHRLRGDIVKGIRDQAPGGHKFKQLSPLTIALRKLAGFRGEKALIRTGALMRSVGVRREHFMRYRVGVLRAEGNQLNIAKVHEEGKTIVIRVTPKMRRFWFAALRRIGKTGSGSGSPSKWKRGILILKIPARPYIRPVYDQYKREQDKSAARIMRHAAVLLRGKYGSF